MSEWVAEDRNRDLSNLCDDVWTVESVPIYRIVECCDDYGLQSRRFVKAWEQLLEEAHAVINKAEEMMT